MMTKQERLREMTRILGGTPRHCRLAAEVLGKLGKELHKRRLGYLDDGWPFHVVVPDGRGTWVSLHCGGFSKQIEIQQLRKDGSPDKRYKERVYLTPRGAANYIGTLV